jgi:hypothetical protein
METLTRVMARTVYRIDLHDPPLQHVSTRKGKVMQRVKGRKTSLKTQSFSTGWSGLQGKSHATLERNTSAGESVSSEKTVAKKKTLLPRSSSEPGMLQKTNVNNEGRHLHTLHSDSCVTTGQSSMQVHTKVEELIKHEEQDSIGCLEDTLEKIGNKELFCLCFVCTVYYHIPF